MFSNYIAHFQSVSQAQGHQSCLNTQRITSILIIIKELERIKRFSENTKNGGNNASHSQQVYPLVMKCFMQDAIIWIHITVRLSEDGEINLIIILFIQYIYYIIAAKHFHRFT